MIKPKPKDILSVHARLQSEVEHLFLIAVFGGSIGSILGMYTFRHKTKHKSFVIGMPAILIVQILIVVAIILSPIEIVVFD